MPASVKAPYETICRYGPPRRHESGGARSNLYGGGIELTEPDRPHQHDLRATVGFIST